MSRTTAPNTSALAELAKLSSVTAPAESLTQTLSLSEIRPDPAQMRRTFNEEGLNELAASIRAEGLLQAIVVRPIATPEEGGHRYEIVAGERRYRAAQIAGLEDIPAVVRSMDDSKASRAQLIENIQREDVDFLQVAQLLKRLVEAEGVTAADLAADLGKSPAWVSQHLAVLKDHDELTQAALEENRFNSVTVFNSFRRLSPQRRRSLLERAREEDRAITRKDLTAKRISNPKKAPAEAKAGEASTESRPAKNSSPRQSLTLRLTPDQAQALADRIGDLSSDEDALAGTLQKLHEFLSTQSS